MLPSFCGSLPWHTWDFYPPKLVTAHPGAALHGDGPPAPAPCAVLGLGAARAALRRGSAILGAALILLYLPSRIRALIFIPSLST